MNNKIVFFNFFRSLLYSFTQFEKVCLIQTFLVSFCRFLPKDCTSLRNNEQLLDIQGFFGLAFFHFPAWNMGYIEKHFFHNVVVLGIVRSTDL